MKRHLRVVCVPLTLAVAAALFPAGASALSVSGGAAWGTPGNDGAPFNLGPVYSQTCFLAGVSGDFIGDPMNPNYVASVEVYKENGWWYIKTRAGSGTGVKGYAIRDLHQ
jgi:hypothetical protein